MFPKIVDITNQRLSNEENENMPQWKGVDYDSKILESEL